ncbi:hypothetical protein CJP74_00645 [Psittacicella melopsittaci]|uniref:DJ-1/PfpI domain-containing protein n=1 Tax=Psittacicella melopsittaci TaxID=2028576 RepID=A0A3A1Y9L1_9GAMM|nr:DJ-1 family glyoxalase III [Psittacicella melopsittaci]RIY33899.1 hypothetical protein CJP74_00645 [Psittacicella melopsittaci]
MTKHVAIVLTSRFETVEALAPVDILRRAGLHVTTISLDEHHLVNSAQHVPVTADKLYAETDMTNFDALVLPGGALDAQKYLDLEKDVAFYAHHAEKLLAAICMAPTVVARMGLLQGKTVTCYPTLASVLEEHGAKYTNEKVVYLEEEKILTSQAPGSAYDFGFKIVEILLGKEKAQEIAEQMFYTLA